jgi:hypothetical protein
MPDAQTEHPTSERAKTAKDTFNMLKDVKAGEKWVIGIGVLTLLVNIAIGAIYYGQLVEMRKSTDAATAESQVSNNTLRELKTGAGTQDTHRLAEQAVKQSSDTNTILSTAGAQAAAMKLLADRASAQAQSSAQQAAAAQLSADAANKLAEHSNKLAEEAQLAIQNALASDRPWIAVHMAISEFDKKKPATVTITATNSGRRPAKLTTFSANGSYFAIFPEAPTFTNEHSASAGMLVPGDSSTIQFLLPAEQVKELLASAAAGPQGQYFIYANVEYTDLMTGAQHISRANWAYNPSTETTPAGFSLAHIYNEAK